MADSYYKELGSLSFPSAPPTPRPPPFYDFGLEPNVLNPRIELANLPLHLPKPKMLKLWKTMKCLVCVELALGIIALIFGAACTGISASSFYYGPTVCFEASGIWVGILCIVTAGLGIGALTVPTGRRCMLISHFVLLIISSVGCGTLTIVSSIWISILSDIGPHSEHEPFLFIFNVILLLTSITLCTYLISVLIFVRGIHQIQSFIF